jgi:hypothetical protein
MDERKLAETIIIRSSHSDHETHLGINLSYFKLDLPIKLDKEKTGLIRIEGLPTMALSFLHNVNEIKEGALTIYEHFVQFVGLDGNPHGRNLYCSAKDLVAGTKVIITNRL